MKEKILMFVIGLLVGAVISTGVFFVYTKAVSCKNNNNAQMQMPGGNQPSMPNGQNSAPSQSTDGNSNQVPERPDSNNSQNSNNNQSETKSS